MKKVRLGYLSTAYHTSFILIGSEWIQKRMDMEVDWRLFPTGPEMIKAFGNKELDLGYIGLPPAIIGIGKGLDIKCVAGGHMEGTVFTAGKGYRTLREQGELRKTLEQFKRKAIGTPSKGSIHDVIIRNLLDKTGLQTEIAVRNFQWADQILEAMEDGTVEGGVGTPPLAVLASRLFGAKIIMPPSIMWPHNPSYGIVATAEMIQGSESVLEGILKMHEEACNLIRKQPNEAAEIASKALGLVDKDFVLEVYRVSPKYCASLPKEYVESTLSFVPFLQKTGYISRGFGESEVFYTYFVDQIHPEKPHYNDPQNLA